MRGAQNLAVNDVADAVSGKEALPDVGLQLLDAQGEAAVLRLDAENDGLYLFAFLDDFRGVLDALGPAQVGDVDEAVDAVFDLDEGAEVGEVADAALDNGAGGVFVAEALPGVLEELLHAERDAAIGGIDAENNGVDLVAGLDELGGMLEALGPGHLREVNQAFDALLELDKRAVVGDRKNAAVDLGADGITLRGVEPGIGRQLLEAERDALLVLVELENLDLNFVGDEETGAGASRWRRRRGLPGPQKDGKKEK